MMRLMPKVFDQQLPAFRQQDILRHEVAVQKTGAVGVVERLAEGGEPRRDFGRVETAVFFFCKQRGEALRLHSVGGNGRPSLA